MGDKTGRLVVLSSPSGGGKTTIIQKMLKKYPHWCYSISATTRPPRQGEKDGRDYYFMDTETFHQKRRCQEFLEWAGVHNYYYGTPQKPILTMIGKGMTVLLDIDVQGGVQVKKNYPQALLIFLMPPNLKVLKERLRKRGTETRESLKTRLANARREMEMAAEYDIKIINDDLNQTLKEVIRVIENS